MWDVSKAKPSCFNKPFKCTWKVPECQISELQTPIGKTCGNKAWNVPICTPYAPKAALELVTFLSQLPPLSWFEWGLKLLFSFLGGERRGGGFQGKASMCRPGWPLTHRDPHASASCRIKGVCSTAFGASLWSSSGPLEKTEVILNTWSLTWDEEHQVLEIGDKVQWWPFPFRRGISVANI